MLLSCMHNLGFMIIYHAVYLMAAVVVDGHWSLNSGYRVHSPHQNIVITIKHAWSLSTGNLIATFLESRS